jgi:hypothetical protein
LSENDRIPDHSALERKSTALLMGVETLTLLRSDDELSSLSCDEAIDLVTCLRPQSLTPKLYRQVLSILISDCHEISRDSMIQAGNTVRRTMLRNNFTN